MPVSWSEADADAASFLAVVPPDDVVRRIIALRHAAGRPTPVLPHVTVKAQPNLERTDLWRPRVRAALAEIAPFEVALGPVEWFGDGIVYLGVGNPIVAVHRALLAAVESVTNGERFEYEGGNFVPHLTLGAIFAGETPDQLRQIANAAAIETWPQLQVAEVVEFRREGHGAEYAPIDTYSLGET